MTTPFEIPQAYDAPTVGGQKMRGMWRLVGGGERAQKVEQVQAPGFLGAFTIVRLEGMVDLEYRVEVWTVEDYNWLRTMLQVFRQGMKLRPPKGPVVYDIQDLAIEHLEIKRAVCAKLTKIEHAGRGKHVTLIGFGEYKKKLPLGGTPAARPQSETEKTIERVNDDLTKMKAELATAQKIAASKGFTLF